MAPTSTLHVADLGDRQVFFNATGTFLKLREMNDTYEIEELSDLLRHVGVDLRTFPVPDSACERFCAEAPYLADPDGAEYALVLKAVSEHIAPYVPRQPFAPLR